MSLNSNFSLTPWDFSPPPHSELDDHGVFKLGDQLQGRHIALLVCGGIAAMKAPLIARELRKRGAKVTPMLSSEGARYVTVESLAWAADAPVLTQLTSRAEHLGDGVQFDAYLVAPATYNTINKFAIGVADGLLTTVLASALGRLERGKSKILIAPTMHGSMHTSILTESMKSLNARGVQFIQPRADYGKHNIPSEQRLIWEVTRALSQSPLKNRGVLVTGGPTPVKIDDVRRLTNKFTGSLAIEIAMELYARGALIKLVLGVGSHTPPDCLKDHVEWVEDYDAYRDRTLTLAQDPLCDFGIFTAAVADYRPTVHTEGKIQSGLPQLQLSLEPTEKVIDLVQQTCPDLLMITFKYQEGLTHEQLMSIADQRTHRFLSVLANRGEERGPNGEQVGWLCVRDQPPQQLVGKPEIAKGICNLMEVYTQDDTSRLAPIKESG